VPRASGWKVGFGAVVLDRVAELPGGRLRVHDRRTRSASGSYDPEPSTVTLSPLWMFASGPAAATGARFAPQVPSPRQFMAQQRPSSEQAAPSARQPGFAHAPEAHDIGGKQSALVTQTSPAMLGAHLLDWQSPPQHAEALPQASPALAHDDAAAPLDPPLPHAETASASTRHPRMRRIVTLPRAMIHGGFRRRARHGGGRGDHTTRPLFEHLHER
jgi:hypothetical protein